MRILEWVPPAGPEPFGVTSRSTAAATPVEFACAVVVEVGGRASQRHGSELESGHSVGGFAFGLNVDSTRGATSESFCCFAADGAVCE